MGGNKVKKRILGILMSMTMLVTLTAGCGAKGADKSSDTSNNSVSGDSAQGTETNANTYEGIPITSDKVELTVWESTAGADKFVIEAGKKFHELYPNITVKYVNVELGDAPGQIALDGPAGVGPDLFAVPSNAIGTLIESGHILPSQNEAYLKKHLLGSCSAAITMQDKLWGYPLSADTYTLFYNKALISEDQVPKTFDDLKTWCTTFNANNPGKQGFLMSPDAYYAYIFLSKDNNQVFGPKGDDPTTTYVNTPQAVEGMEYYQSLRKIFDVPSADVTAAYCDGAFSSGTAAMYLTGLWNVSNFKDAGIDFGVTTIPTLPGSDVPPSSLSNARDMVVSAYSNHPNEAAAFGLFMVSDKMQKLRFDLTGTLPSVNVSVDADYVAGFLKQLEYANPTPAIAKMNDFWDPMDAATKNIWDGADVQKELDGANKAILAE